MSPPTPDTPTIALFGGTAGTGLCFLTQLLEVAPNTHVNVLARTPSKLASLESSSYTNLHIIKDDIRSIPSLKKCLVRDGEIVDIVVSSIGMTIQRQGFSLASADTTICEEGTKAILQALGELEVEMGLEKRTRLVVLSTTGISERGRDVPCAMMPLYRMLHVPHVDKKKMEDVVVASGREWVAVRPSFLINGKRHGLEALRTSVEVDGEGNGEGNCEEVAIGYSISRADVAGWILEECVLGGEERWGMWCGKMVTLTY